MRCSEPGQRAAVASLAPRGPVAEFVRPTSIEVNMSQIPAKTRYRIEAQGFLERL